MRQRNTEGWLQMTDAVEEKGLAGTMARVCKGRERKLMPGMGSGNRK